jgi:hypothetical protein
MAAEPTIKILCTLNILQIMGTVQHNTDTTSSGYKYLDNHYTYTRYIK